MAHDSEVDTAIAGLQAQVRELQAIVQSLPKAAEKPTSPAPASNSQATTTPINESTANASTNEALQLELSQLRTENAKLKYRIEQLCTSYDAKVEALKQQSS
ncbi:hypothetical protein H4R34_003889 [Dimargaris verticillata]|uniref:Uncharacterized protein n=1 Tax=Dimargaris verticillata TaxID=2761393 RepID=A0A9W8AZ77_9FUNG|nr:hypothetical protein H4R34_003889 [Dimargaris verticillata]